MSYFVLGILGFITSFIVTTSAISIFKTNRLIIRLMQDLDKLRKRVDENDIQISMLNQRLKIQREESMAAAIADATVNPEKYLQAPIDVQFTTGG